MSYKQFFIAFFALCFCACSKGDDPAVPTTPTPVDTTKQDTVIRPTDQPYLPNCSEKRGLGYNFKDVIEVSCFGKSISWCYNWGTQEDSICDLMLGLYKTDFVPMAWTTNFNETQIRSWVQTHPRCKYLLAFNEPNLTDQANLTPAEAAAAWPRLKALADELKLKIVAPAMNYGTKAGYSDPIVWLDEFFTLVPKSDVCALALHCYMGNPSAMKSFVDRFDKYDLPIWMTEFCGWETSISSLAAQEGYLNNALAWMEADPRIERYAWFIAKSSSSVDKYPYNQLLTHDYVPELTELGKLYCAMPNITNPTTQWAELPMNLNLYCNSVATEAARQKSYAQASQLRVSTDSLAPASGMMLEYFMGDQWLEYKIEAASDLSSVYVRYQSAKDAILQVQLDGAKTMAVLMPASAKWAEASSQFTVAKGQHTLRISMFGGYCNLSTIWFK